jgi:DNA-directed RNA polymerase subunit RPC12/RpoP
MSAILVCNRCGHRHHGHTVETDAGPRDIYDDLEIVLSGEVRSLGIGKKCPKCHLSILAMPSGKIFIVYEATQ